MHGIDPSDAPNDFLCPISLDLMLDPVILHTGHTYDRKSIQRWLDTGHRTCPITMQRLSDISLTPNHMLRRLIREWLEQNRLKQEKQDEEVLGGLVNALQQPSMLESVDKLREMKVILGKNEYMKRRCMVHEAGWCALLVSMLKKPDVNEEINLEVISILVQLRMDLRAKEDLGVGICVCRLLDFLHHGKIEARRNAAKLLASVDASGLMRFESKVESGVKCLLGERATMGEGLMLLKELAMNSSSDNKDLERWVIERGFVSAMAELLPSLNTECCEIALEIMDKICCNGGEEGTRTLMIFTPTIVSNLTAVLMKSSDKCTIYAVLILLAFFKLHYQQKQEDYHHNCGYNPRDSDHDHGAGNHESSVIMRRPAGAHDSNFLHLIPGLPRKLLLVLQSNCTPALKKSCAELLKILDHQARQAGPLANFSVSYGNTSNNLLR